MRAAVCRSYGPPEVLEIEDIPRPSIQDDDEVLIMVHSASVNPSDYLLRSGHLAVRLVTGLRKPKRQILGTDVAGTIESVGKHVERFRVGDRVFGGCRGSHAEYASAHQNSIGMMAANAAYQEAAAMPTAALTALQALRDVAKIEEGYKVLIYGASGGVGHFAVQLARFFGTQVTAVCSTSNLAWIKDLGAHHVIDYTTDDFAKNGKKYDVILEYLTLKPKLTLLPASGMKDPAGLFASTCPRPAMDCSSGLATVTSTGAKKS